MQITLDTLRQFYARLVTTAGGAADPRIEAAFAAVHREDYLPPGPWHVFVFPTMQYVETVNSDPAQLYQDCLVAVDKEKGIHNGQPSLHARNLAAVNVQLGEDVLQVGCGGGYYTAVLALLTGEEGRVTALELEPEMADMATQHLQSYPHIQVENRSGATPPLPASDVIYVSAGASDVPECWLDALRPDGRLIFPLTPGDGLGGMLLVTRPASGANFHARFVGRAAFIPCIGAQTELSARRLKTAFEQGQPSDVQSLRRGSPKKADSCWFAGDNWWLSAEPL